jgi:hypothetical protein
MNIFTNDKYHEGQLARARRFRNYGILAVVLSFLMSILASYYLPLIYLAYPFLLVGFPVWTHGRSLHRRLTAYPRPDKLVNEALKGLSNKYTLYHFAEIGAARVKHLLAMPNGLIVMESSDAGGTVRCGEQKGQDRWQNRSGWLDRLSGINPPVGNPSRELDASIAATKDALAQIGKPSVPVVGFAVFTRDPQIEISSCKYEGIPTDELKDTIRGIYYELGGDRGEGGSVDRLLTSDDRRKLHLLLAPSFPQPATAARPVPARRKAAEKVQ